MVDHVADVVLRRRVGVVAVLVHLRVQVIQNGFDLLGLSIVLTLLEKVHGFLWWGSLYTMNLPRDV